MMHAAQMPALQRLRPGWQPQRLQGLPTRIGLWSVCCQAALPLPLCCRWLDACLRTQVPRLMPISLQLAGLNCHQVLPFCDFMTACYRKHGQLQLHVSKTSGTSSPMCCYLRFCYI